MIASLFSAITWVHIWKKMGKTSTFCTKTYKEITYKKGKNPKNQQDAQISLQSRAVSTANICDRRVLLEAAAPVNFQVVFELEGVT